MERRRGRLGRHGGDGTAQAESQEDEPAAQGASRRFGHRASPADGRYSTFVATRLSPARVKDATGDRTIGLHLEVDVAGGPAQRERLLRVRHQLQRLPVVVEVAALPDERRERDVDVRRGRAPVALLQREDLRRQESIAKHVLDPPRDVVSLHMPLQVFRRTPGRDRSKIRESTSALARGQAAPREDEGLSRRDGHVRVFVAVTDV